MLAESDTFLLSANFFEWCHGCGSALNNSALSGSPSLVREPYKEIRSALLSTSVRHCCLHVIQFRLDMDVGRDFNGRHVADVFDCVESLFEVDVGYPKALFPFVCWLSELVKCVQVVSRGVL